MSPVESPADSSQSSVQSTALDALLLSVRIGTGAGSKPNRAAYYPSASDSESEGDIVERENSGWPSTATATATATAGGGAAAFGGLADLGHGVQRTRERSLTPLHAEEEVEIVDLVSASSSSTESDESDDGTIAATAQKKRHNLIDSDSSSEEEEEAEESYGAADSPPAALLPALVAALPGDYRPTLPPQRPKVRAEAPHPGPIAKPAAAAACVPSAAAFKKQREGLARELYTEYNRRIFDGQLPADLDIKWNNRLASTAGTTHYQRMRPADAALPVIYTAHIELSSKVLDGRARVERTLAHEMCHVAAWLLDHTAKPPHGEAFKRWADRAMRVLPHLDISTCHDYQIFYAWRWQCVACSQEYGRHSNSIDVGKKVCGQCKGRLISLGRFARDGSPAKARAPTAFSEYVKTNFAAAKRECLPTTPASAVMKKLSARWAAQQEGRKPAVATQHEAEVVNLFSQLDL